MAQANASRPLVGPRSGENGLLWLIKIVTGFFIIFLIGIHFVVNHLIGVTGLLTYADVVRYYSNPIIPLMEIVFLIFVVSHSLIGLRSILLDLRPSAGVLQAIDWLFTAIGVVAVVYGIWLIRAIVTRGS
ncbi:MAG TPA: hypothetical protein VF823_04320 [Anaerolineales bacterium]